MHVGVGSSMSYLKGWDDQTLSRLASKDLTLIGAVTTKFVSLFHKELPFGHKKL